MPSIETQLQDLHRIVNRIAFKLANSETANNTITGDAGTLGGHTSVYYLNASNISAGILSVNRLDPSVTRQGNTFNSAGGLVQLNTGGKLPALDGSLLTNLPSSGSSSISLSDNLTTSSGGTALDARQGSILKGLIDAATTAIGGKLSASSNLSDIASASTARTNLGLGTIALKNSLATGDIPDLSSIYAPVSSITTINTALSGKQATLVSGSTIKTVNGTSLLGSGDITVTGNGSSISVTDNLTTSATGTVLDAHQGYVLKGLIDTNTTALSNKVDVVGGKVLSTNDYTTAEKTKLTGIATAATANSTDATLLSRTNHTGSQLASTISDFQTQVNANTNVTANTAAQHTHSNKTLLDSYTQTEVNLSDAVTKKHSHTNLTALNNVTGTNTGDETGASLKTKLEALTGTSRLNASAIQNLPTGSATSQVTALTSSSSISWDFTLGDIATLTLANNAVLSISNANDGDSGYLIVTQDSTGGRTLSLPDGTGITVYSAASKVTTLGFVKVGGVFKWTGDYVLTTTGSGAATLTGNVLNIPAGGSTTIVDNLTTSTSGSALDAHQGFVIKGLIDTNTTSISGKLTASSNLSDLANVTTARTSLGLGSYALKNSLVTGDIPDISATYATQSQLTTTNTSVSSKQPQLNGTGFVKTSGTTVSYDNSTYLTANQSITLSGDISGTGTTAITTAIGASKVTNTMLAGSITAAKLVGSDITITESQVTNLTTDLAAKAPLSLTLNAQTTSYTLVLGDAAKLVTLANASANTVTIPNNTTVAFPIGTQITVTQLGAGQTSFVAAGSVVTNSADSALKLRVQYSTATLIKTGTNLWLITGDLTV